MDSKLQRLIQLRMGGMVERCHTVRHQGSYSVAAHSWGVAVLMFVLWPKDFPRLAAYCIFHDVPEAWVGDAPAPVKKFDSAIKAAYDAMERSIFERLSIPNDANLGPDDKAKLRACDHLELYCWALEQVASGNANARCVLQELDGFFKLSPLPKEAHDLYCVMANADFAYDLREGYRALFPRN